MAQELADKHGMVFSVYPCVVAGDDHAKVPKSSIQVTSAQIEFESSTIEGDGFTIIVHPDRITLNVPKGEPAYKYEGGIEGLPGVMMKTVMHNELDRYDYDLTDPDSIETLYAKVAEIIGSDPAG